MRRRGEVKPKKVNNTATILVEKRRIVKKNSRGLRGENARPAGSLHGYPPRRQKRVWRDAAQAQAQVVQAIRACQVFGSRAGGFESCSGKNTLRSRRKATGRLRGIRLSARPRRWLEEDLHCARHPAEAVVCTVDDDIGRDDARMNGVDRNAAAARAELFGQRAGEEQVAEFTVP